MYYSVAVIDFGTAKIKGAVAQKYADGSFKIVAREEVDSDGCIVRGIVYNLEETAAKLTEILDSLETQIHRTIVKVYANINGQSLRSRPHEVEETYPGGHELTQEDIDRIIERLNVNADETYEPIGEVDQIYYVDGNLTERPIGVKARTLKVKSQMILARRSLRENIYSVLEKKLEIGVAGILPSTVLLGERFLTKDQRRIGAAIIDFGAGCTGVAVYSKGSLAGLMTLPLGSRNITYDLTSLHISRSEAERIKKSKGSANSAKSGEETVNVQTVDERTTKALPLYKVNRFVEARAQEIMDNVLAFVSKTLGHTNLPGGVVITGGGSKLQELPNKAADTLGSKVELASNTKETDNNYYLTNPEWNVIFAMCHAAREECTEPSVETEEVSEPDQPKQPEQEGGTTKHTFEDAGKDRENEDSGHSQPSLFPDNDWDSITSDTKVDYKEPQKEKTEEGRKLPPILGGGKGKKKNSIFSGLLDRILPSDVDENE